MTNDRMVENRMTITVLDRFSPNENEPGPISSNAPPNSVTRRPNRSFFVHLNTYKNDFILINRTYHNIWTSAVDLGVSARGLKHPPFRVLNFFCSIVNYM